MIGKLTGKLDSLETDHLILDVGGVGYIVFCSAHSLRSIGGLGDIVSLIIETQVREEYIHLYGFQNQDEREAFKQLIKVKGVGNKLAMAILGALKPQELSSCLIAQDKSAFAKIPGVGPKLADRILSELKGQNLILKNHDLPGPAHQKLATPNNIIHDGVSALTNLGFNRTEAFNVVTKLLHSQPELSIGVLIRLALKELAK